MSKVITVTFPGGKRVDAQIGEHSVQTDQSVRNGGEGRYPQPFDLFLSSLVTCAGIYALEYCTDNQLPSEGLALTLNAEWNAEKRLCDQMCIVLTLPGGFPEEHTDGIIDAIGPCTVKRHLSNEIAYTIKIAG